MRHWRPALILASILSASEALPMQKEEGIVKIPSHHSVDETVESSRPFSNPKAWRFRAGRSQRQS